MITVKIEINGKVIGKISARNMGCVEGNNVPPDWRYYGIVGTKKTILHGRNHGALSLAKTMLDCLQESDLIQENK